MGSGSRLQDLLGALVIMDLISSRVTGVNLEIHVCCMLYVVNVIPKKLHAKMKQKLQKRF